MTAKVHDLLSRRATRQRPALYFETDVEALSFARQQVRELQDRADSALLLNGQELDLPLSQLAAVLDACLRLYTRPENQGAPDAGR
jgi:hypothetical protein